jgi:hypothetical protein
VKSGLARFDRQAFAICVLLLQSQKKSALDRFCKLGRRANAVRVSVHARLRSRVTLADVPPVMDGTERFRDKLRATFNSFDRGNRRSPTTTSAHDSCRTIFPAFKQRRRISPIFPVANTSALKRT